MAWTPMAWTPMAYGLDTYGLDAYQNPVWMAHPVKTHFHGPLGTYGLDTYGLDSFFYRVRRTIRVNGDVLSSTYSQT